MNTWKRPRQKRGPPHTERGRIVSESFVNEVVPVTMLGCEGTRGHGLWTQTHGVMRLNGIWRQYCWDEVIVVEAINGPGDM